MFVTKVFSERLLCCWISSSHVRHVSDERRVTGETCICQVEKVEGKRVGNTQYYSYDCVISFITQIRW